jgi:hypothetical protein
MLCHQLAFFALTALPSLLVRCARALPLRQMARACALFVDRDVRPRVQDAVDDIFVLYKDCVLTERTDAELTLTAHRTSTETRLQQGAENTVHEFQHIIDDTTTANIAKIDDAVRTATAVFEAKRASIVDSIMAAHRASGKGPADKPNPQVLFSDSDTTAPPLPPQTDLQNLAKRGTPMGASRAAYTDRH